MVQSVAFWMNQNSFFIIINHNAREREHFSENITDSYFNSLGFLDWVSVQK